MGLRNRSNETPDRVIHTRLYGDKAKKILSYIFCPNEDKCYNLTNYLSNNKYGGQVLRGMRYLYVFCADDDEICLCSGADSFDYRRSPLGKCKTAEKRAEAVVKFIAGACKLDVYDGPDSETWCLLDAQVKSVEGWNASNDKPAFSKLAAVYSKKGGVPAPTFTVGDVFKLCKALKSPEKFKKQYAADAEDFIGRAADPMTVEMRASALAERARIIEERDRKIADARQKYREVVFENDTAYRETKKKCQDECIAAISEIAEMLGVDRQELLSDLPAVPMY